MPKIFQDELFCGTSSEWGLKGVAGDPRQQATSVFLQPSAGGEGS